MKFQKKQSQMVRTKVAIKVICKDIVPIEAVAKYDETKNNLKKIKQKIRIARNG